MKKFLSIILAICFAFTIGMTFACSAPTGDDNSDSNNGGTTPPPTATAITEEEWLSTLELSDVSNVHITEKITPKGSSIAKNPELWITETMMVVNQYGIQEGYERSIDYNEISDTKKVYGIYSGISYDELTFDAENKNYIVNKTISVDASNALTLTKGINYTFTNVIISINTDYFFVEKVSADLKITLENNSAQEFTVEYTYSDFGVATCPNI